MILWKVSVAGINHSRLWAAIVYIRGQARYTVPCNQTIKILLWSLLWNLQFSLWSEPVLFCCHSYAKYGIKADVQPGKHLQGIRSTKKPAPFHNYSITKSCTYKNKGPPSISLPSSTAEWESSRLKTNHNRSCKGKSFHICTTCCQFFKSLPPHHRSHSFDRLLYCGGRKTLWAIW